MKSSQLDLLGLACRAHKVALGDEIYTSFKKGQVKFLFIASDASFKTKERLHKKIFYYKTKYDDTYASCDLSGALGKSNVKIAAVLDDGFAQAIVKKGGSKNGETKS